MDDNIFLISKYGVSLCVYLNNFANWRHAFELKELRTLHMKIMWYGDSRWQVIRTLTKGDLKPILRVKFVFLSNVLGYLATFKEMKCYHSM